MNANPREKGRCGTSALRPFRVNVREAELTELRKRIKATRFPERETVADFSQGLPSATIQELARYWANEYDWRKVEARLNTYPQFITEIDGLDIHFIHVRSNDENALPLIISHGWPGTIIEQLNIIDLLTNPTAHGASASDSFHLVIPSMPGYGFSAKPTTTGWDPNRIARAWAALMTRLGYTKFVAQGGDWGGLVTQQMAVQAPPGLIGIHTNMPGAVPPELDDAAAAGAPAPSALLADERQAYEQLAFVYKHVQYALCMAALPQTLTGLADSPVALASFLLDPGLSLFLARWMRDDQRGLKFVPYSFDWRDATLTRDDLLDIITLFWLTNTGVSAARLYWENKLPYFSPKGISMPVAVSVFPDELYACPRTWAERAFPKLIYYNRLDKGGHFAAWEQPGLLSEELRASFRSLRT